MACTRALPILGPTRISHSCPGGAVFDQLDDGGPDDLVGRQGLGDRLPQQQLGHALDLFLDLEHGVPGHEPDFDGLALPLALDLGLGVPQDFLRRRLGLPHDLRRPGSRLVQNPGGFGAGGVDAVLLQLSRKGRDIRFHEDPPRRTAAILRPAPGEVKARDPGVSLSRPFGSR